MYSCAVPHIAPAHRGGTDIIGLRATCDNELHITRVLIWPALFSVSLPLTVKLQSKRAHGDTYCMPVVARTGVIGLRAACDELYISRADKSGPRFEVSQSVAAYRKGESSARWYVRQYLYYWSACCVLQRAVYHTSNLVWSAVFSVSVIRALFFFVLAYSGLVYAAGRKEKTKKTH